MFFLDGDKLNYSFYLNWAINKMRTGSLFVVDNILFKGGVVEGENKYATSIRIMTEQLKQSNAFDYCFVPIGDCMVVAIKK